MCEPNYDVIIVGSGPAGATLSYLLAKSGVNTLLIERDSSFEREFRGPAYQPCILKYFNQMGILDDILSIDHSVLSVLKAKEKGKIAFQMSFSHLPKPFNYVIALDQGPILRKLVQLASEYQNFTFLGNTSVEDLVYDNGVISGVAVTINGQKKSVKSRLVVAADGRFSTLRDLAGISMQKTQQSFDVIWFDMENYLQKKYTLELEFSDHGILIYIPQETGHVRVGWILPKGTYPKLQSEGINRFHEKLAKVDADLKPILPKVLPSFKKCSLLDVKIAVAKEWMRDGLLLIGDAAHVASPVGAQGNKLAIQDAVLAHPHIMQALQKPSRFVRKDELIKYLKARMSETKKIFFVQKLIGKMGVQINSSLLRKIQSTIFPYVQKLFGNKMVNIIAFGFDPLDVDRSWFQKESEYSNLHRYFFLKIANIEQEANNAYSFYFEVPEHLSPFFSYLPGQFITLRLLDKGQLFKRCYSLSSSPSYDRKLRITVKRVEGGIISNDLIETVKIGDEILVLPPAGQFTPEKSATDYFFVAGGSGITPIFSLIRTLIDTPDVKHIHLLYVNHNEESIIFKEVLDELQKAQPEKFILIHNLTKAPFRWKGLTGRLTEEKFKNLLPTNLTNMYFYLCGPQGLMNLVTNSLTEKGVSENHIVVEKFTSLAEPFEIAQTTVMAEPALIIGSGEEESNSTEKRVRISLANQHYEIYVKEGESILDAALRENLSPPFSCREGICSTCIAQLSAGKVQMNKHQALSHSEAENGKILTCQAVPLNNHCEVNYD